jgi:two-component system, LytTR family, response regulator LytT
MNILIVEDEQHSREELEYQLSQLEPNANIQSAENAMNAWERLEAADTAEDDAAFDLIFLDIQMPGMNGLELAARVARLTSPPRIVFATANPEHAITAFDLEGIDYLLKPYRSARLAQTLERVRKLMLEPKANTNQTIQLEKIWAARGEVGVLLSPNDILFCQADGATVSARTIERETLPLRFSLQDLETRFPNGPFARVHKSFLVNLEHVRQVEPFFSGSYRLLLSDESSRVPLSRQYAKVLRKRLAWF